MEWEEKGDGRKMIMWRGRCLSSVTLKLRMPKGSVVPDSVPLSWLMNDRERERERERVRK